jgi:hypothetical protein
VPRDMSDITVTLAFGVGTIFALAGLAKASMRASTVSTLAQHPLVPTKLAGAATAVIILGEAAIAFSTLSDIGRREGLVGGGLLLLAFGVANAGAVRRDPTARLDCGCLGAALPIQMGLGASVINILLGLTCLGVALGSGSVGLPAHAWALAGTGAVIGVVYWVGLYGWSVARRSEAHSGALASGRVR